MTKLLFVGDGERDKAMLPPMVARILGAPVEPEFDSWARLNDGGRGYGRRLRYQMIRARDRACSGVVAVVDRDRDRRGNRIRSLCESRDAEKLKVNYTPTAVGEAIPHGEAWLLDDPKAVRTGMQLPTDAEVPRWRERDNCKSILEAIFEACPRCADEPLAVWADIASNIDPVRYQHSRDTGFEAFQADVGTELLGAVSA